MLPPQMSNALSAAEITETRQDLAILCGEFLCIARGLSPRTILFSVETFSVRLASMFILRGTVVVNKVFVASMILIFMMISSIVSARQQMGGGDLLFTPEKAPRVLFSHENHLKAERLKCASCHYRFFQMAHGSWKMDMEKMTKGGFCGECHNGRIAFSVKDRGNCSRCHR